jgi:lipocalin-like protein
VNLRRIRPDLTAGSPHAVESPESQIMTRLRFLLAALLPAAVRAASGAGRFVGVWNLVSCESQLPSGEVAYPYGRKPAGRITYDSRGRMSAQLMDTGRKPFSREDRRVASAEEIKQAYLGYQAYYGAYDVDEKRNTVIHHVQAAMIPNWVGTDLQRTYEFSGDKLILVAAQVDGAKNRVVWQRAPK